MAQRVTVGVANHLAGRSGVSGEISPARWIAPCALRIPMPGLHKQICVLAIADRAPTSREDLLNLVGTKEDVGRIAGDTIDGGSQGIDRAEFIHHVARSRVDSDGLREGGRT